MMRSDRAARHRHDLLRGGVSVEGPGAQLRDAVGNDRAPAAHHQRVGLRLDDRIAVRPGIIHLVGGRHRDATEFGAEDKGIVSDFRHIRGNVYLLQGEAGIKGVFLDYRKAVGEVDLFQTGGKEGSLSNPDEAVRKVDMLQCLATDKRIRFDLGDTGGDVDLLQFLTFIEGTLPYLLEAIGKVNLLQLATAQEGIVPDLDDPVQDDDSLQAVMAGERILLDFRDTFRELYFRPLSVVQILIQLIHINNDLE